MSGPSKPDIMNRILHRRLAQLPPTSLATSFTTEPGGTPRMPSSAPPPTSSVVESGHSSRTPLPPLLLPLHPHSTLSPPHSPPFSSLPPLPSPDPLTTLSPTHESSDVRLSSNSVARATELPSASDRAPLPKDSELIGEPFLGFTRPCTPEHNVGSATNLAPATIPSPYVPTLRDPIIEAPSSSLSPSSSSPPPSPSPSSSSSPPSSFSPSSSSSFATATPTATIHDHAEDRHQERNIASTIGEVGVSALPQRPTAPLSTTMLQRARDILEPAPIALSTFFSRPWPLPPSPIATNPIDHISAVEKQHGELPIRSSARETMDEMERCHQSAPELTWSPAPCTTRVAMEDVLQALTEIPNANVPRIWLGPSTDTSSAHTTVPSIEPLRSATHSVWWIPCALLLTLLLALDAYAIQWCHCWIYGTLSSIKSQTSPSIIEHNGQWLVGRLLTFLRSLYHLTVACIARLRSRGTLAIINPSADIVPISSPTASPTRRALSLLLLDAETTSDRPSIAMDRAEEVAQPQCTYASAAPLLLTCNRPGWSPTIPQCLALQSATGTLLSSPYDQRMARYAVYTAQWIALLHPVLLGVVLGIVGTACYVGGQLTRITLQILLYVVRTDLMDLQWLKYLLDRTIDALCYGTMLVAWTLLISLLMLSAYARCAPKRAPWHAALNHTVHQESLQSVRNAFTKSAPAIDPAQLAETIDVLRPCNVGQLDWTYRIGRLASQNSTRRMSALSADAWLRDACRATPLLHLWIQSHGLSADSITCTALNALSLRLDMDLDLHVPLDATPSPTRSMDAPGPAHDCVRTNVSGLTPNDFGTTSLRAYGTTWSMVVHATQWSLVLWQRVTRPVTWILRRINPIAAAMECESPFLLQLLIDKLANAMVRIEIAQRNPYSIVARSAARTHALREEHRMLDGVEQLPSTPQFFCHWIDDPVAMTHEPHFLSRLVSYARLAIGMPSSLLEPNRWPPGSANLRAQHGAVFAGWMRESLPFHTLATMAIGSTSGPWLPRQLFLRPDRALAIGTRDPHKTRRAPDQEGEYRDQDGEHHDQDGEHHDQEREHRDRSAHGTRDPTSTKDHDTTVAAIDRYNMVVSRLLGEQATVTSQMHVGQLVMPWHNGPYMNVLLEQLMDRALYYNTPYALALQA